MNRQTRIAQGIVLVLGAVVGDGPDHDFGIVASRESAVCVGPIVLRLPFLVCGHGPSSFLGVAKVPRSLGRIFIHREVAERVNRIAFLARLNDEFLGKFPIGKSRQAERTRGVGCRQIPTPIT